MIGRAAAETPSSNRGYSETERIGVVIDWLACSVDLLAVLAACSAVAHGPGADDRFAVCDDLNGEGAMAPEVAQRVAAFYFGNLFQLGERRRGQFYSWRFSLLDESGDHVGMIECGGVHTYRKNGTVTARVELTGAGCRIFQTSSGSDHAQRWSLLASLLGATDARITRIDIAADDFLGQYPISWALDKYEAGAFDKRGQRPKARLINDLDNGTGKTLYIGARGGERQLRCYEKGKEQGDPASPWMRYEAEFHASVRLELPLEMLTDPAPYLVGAYPALDFVDGIGDRLRIAAAELAANVDRAVRQFRRIYGPMINAMLHASGGDVDMLARLVQGTARPKLPKWCGSIGDADQLLTAILFAPSGAPEADPGPTTNSA